MICGILIVIVVIIIATTAIKSKNKKKRNFNVSINITTENKSPSCQERRTVRKEIKFLNDYTVIDTETTGIGDNDKIVEIAAAKIRNGVITETFEKLINPKMHIDSNVTKINGISDDMVANCPSFKEIENEFLSFIGNDTLVGHNIPFDLKFIKRELSTELNNKYQDTLTIAKKIISGVENYKLVTLVKYLNIQDSQTHRAENDVDITYKLYEALKMKNEGKSLFITQSEIIKESGSLYKGNVKKVDVEEFWRDIENNKLPAYFTNLNMIDVDDDPSYDIIDIESLMKTSAADRGDTAVKRVNEQYKFIKNEILSLGGKFYGKGAKSAKSYIEFYFSDYSDYKDCKNNNLKLYHASDVEAFLKNHRDEIINSFQK